MSIFGWVLFGFMVGLVARVLMPGRDPLGVIGTVVLGIAGALLAGWVGQAIGMYPSAGGMGFVAATLGAIIVLAVYYGVYGLFGRAGHSHLGHTSQSDSASPAAGNLVEHPGHSGPTRKAG